MKNTHGKIYTVCSSFLLAFLSLTGLGNAWANGSIIRNGYDGHPHSMWIDGWSSGHFMGPFVILVLVVCVAIIAVLVRKRPGKGANGERANPTSLRDPFKILQERFARGEIDADEYEERRRTLSQ